MTAPVKDRTVSEDKYKPPADEQTLAKLLEAAYVLQEHNRELQHLRFRRGLMRLEAEGDGYEHQDQSSLAKSLIPPERAESTTTSAERAAVLEALKKMQPDLSAMIDHLGAPTESAAQPAAAPSISYSCRKCGHRVMPDEQFCGQCGMPRGRDFEPTNIQSKVASLWHMQESQRKANGVESLRTSMSKAGQDPDLPRPRLPLEDPIDQQIPEPFRSEDLEFTDKSAIAASIPSELQALLGIGDDKFADEAEVVSAESPENSQALVKSEIKRAAVWSSAASARGFLEQLGSTKRGGRVLRLWNTHRGDIYLGIAVILVACVLGWGIWSSHSGRATATPAKTAATQRKPPVDPGLSFFDRVLIQLGLAEAPEPPVDKGNPRVQVWVDLHTALYYCPGADQYGKTPQGKFTTQRDAELDQFEPAYRKVCN